MSVQRQTEIEICGTPGMRLNPYNETATYQIQLHTTDPDSTIHAVICLVMHPASGRFAFWPEWYE